MSRKIILTVLVVLMVLSGNAFGGTYGGGTGEPNNPYLIYDAIQMNDIGADANDWDKHFKLMANIDLGGFTGASFNIIGDNSIEPFSGVFDGNDHIISNFTLSGRTRIGLFGFVDGENAEIRNLGLIGPNVDAGTRHHAGALVGTLQSGKITNCFAQGGSVMGDDDVGGLVGRNHGSITNCYATGSVTGDRYFGGLVGYNRGTITNCYATGNVEGEACVGGLVGAHYEGTITNCYAAGKVTGINVTGGLIGTGSGHVINSYWNLETSRQQISAGGEGKTTAQMMMESTFFGWGFCDVVWTINEDLDYPRLAWEDKPGEPVVNMFPLEGNGDANSPYLVHTPDELNVIGLFPCTRDKRFKLMADIDLSDYKGEEFNIIVNFSGVFDGNDHTISNFTYSSNRAYYIGLFGSVRGENAEIRNLRLIGTNVDAGMRYHVGALVGRLQSGKISNCYAKGSVTGGEDVGGLVGRNDNGTITNCSAESTVNGNWWVGGLVGKNDEGTITNCYSTGNIEGGHKVGGLVGENDNGTVTNCYAEGSVTGEDDVGGLVGYNRSASITNCYATANVVGEDRWVGGLVGYNRGVITNCYTTGSVSGNSYVGGLVGTHSESTITNCYAIGSVTGIEYAGGLAGVGSGHVISSYWNLETSDRQISAGGKGKTSDQMKMESTFIGWGFCGAAWTINEDLDYPRLSWEEKPGEPIVDAFPLQGDGNANSPYLVHTPDELNVIGLLPCTGDKHFKLKADIDLSAYKAAEFNIIANFTGVFDGNDHTISNFTYDSNRTSQIGLFGSVRGENAEIRNLRLIDPNVNAGPGVDIGSLVGWLQSGTISDCYSNGVVWGNNRVGGLVGRNDKGSITNCYAQGSSVSGDYNVGGLVGKHDEGTITNCHFTGSVTGNSNVGGLVGYNRVASIANCHFTGRITGNSDVGGLVGYHRGDTITNCYFTGSVTGEDNVGGLVGDNYENTITNCYTTGSVTGNSDVGGLVGYNSGDSASVTNCYSTGSVTGNSDVGGLVGENYEGTVQNSFWNTETSGQLTSDGGTGRTTSQMQIQSTFTDAGWDFAGETENGYMDTWRLCNEGAEYPKLSWQYLPGDFLCPDYVDFVDFAYLAGWWPKLDLLDLTVQTDNWLAGMTPGPASNPVPFNLATGVSVSGYVYLNWTAGSFTTSNDIFFGTSSPPPFVHNESAATFYPGIMERYTRYHWRIDGINAWGKTTGPVWTFTTGSPGQATTPDPFNGARGIALDAALSWDSGFNAVSHDVYFGTSSPPPFIRNQPAATFYPDTMTPYTQYYWRIDEVYDVGSKITGPAWNFTTTSGGATR